MKTRIITFLISVFALAVAVSFGCGGSGGNTNEYTGPVTHVIISGSSASGLQYYGTDGVNQDVTGIAGGEGDDLDGIDSGSDLASAACAFTAAATSLSGDIKVVSDELNCDSLNMCIICTATTPTASTCSIACEGYVPSNAASAADSIDIQITFTHEFLTDMVDPGGVIRFDGTELAWEEFNPDDSTLGIVYDLASCDGDDDYLTVDPSPTLAWLNQAEDDFWNRSFAITAVDPDLDAGPTLGLSTCVVQQHMVARMALLGANVPGANLDLTKGSVWLHGQICADQGNCPTPVGAVTPTPLNP